MQATFGSSHILSRLRASRDAQSRTGGDDKLRLLIVLCLTVTTGAAPTTTWGGDHVRMNVTGAGAELDFDCAIGTITQVVPEKDGPFSLKGTFTPQRSGPTRDGGSRTVDATYSGTIDGDTMTLRIVLSGQDQPARYELVRGGQGNVRKCR